MAISLIEGKIKEISSGTWVEDADRTVRTYVEFEDGRIIHQLVVPNSLDDKLVRGCQSKQDVQLHVRGNVLIGIKMPDGKLYAVAHHVGIVSYFLCLFALGLGIVLTPFIIGLFLLRPGYAMWKEIRLATESRTYFRSFPTAIFLA